VTIYAVGVSGDRTLQRFVERTGARGHDVEMLDIGAVVDASWRVELGPEGDALVICEAEGGERSLDPASSYYVRTIDLSTVLPEPDATAWRHLVAALSFFLDGAPGTVVNRPGAHNHNGSKPLHEAWLARQGFLVPPTLTSCERQRLVAFTRRHGGAIVKALAGTRGSAEWIGPSAFDEFEPDQGPVHLQRVVDGYDVRVHMVAREAFAERIDTDAVDYRDHDAETTYTQTCVPLELVDRMIAAARAMGLLFTGWDFRVDAEGRWWCLEANPMPGYDVYDRRCDGAISDALCGLLADAQRH